MRARELLGRVHRADRPGDVEEAQRRQVEHDVRRRGVRAERLVEHRLQQGPDPQPVAVVDLTGQPGRAGPVAGDPQQVVVVDRGADQLGVVHATHLVDGLVVPATPVVAAQQPGRGMPAQHPLGGPLEGHHPVGTARGRQRAGRLAGQPQPRPAPGGGLDDVSVQQPFQFTGRPGQDLAGARGGHHQELSAADRLPDRHPVVGQPAEHRGRGLVLEVQHPLAHGETARQPGGGDLPQVLVTVRHRAGVIDGSHLVDRSHHLCTWFDHSADRSGSPPTLCYHEALYVGLNVSCPSGAACRAGRVARSASSRIFSESPIIAATPSYLHADRGGGGVDQSLQHDAVPLGQLQQGRQLVRAGVGLQLEAEPDVPEPDRGRPVHPERAADVEVTGRVHPTRHGQPERGGHRAQGDPGTGHQRLQQHVARAQLGAVTSGRRVQAGLGQRGRRAHPAGDPGPVQLAVRGQGDQGGVRVLGVAGLERGLDLLQRGGIHAGHRGAGGWAGPVLSCRWPTRRRAIRAPGC